MSRGGLRRAREVGPGGVEVRYRGGPRYLSQAMLSGAIFMMTPRVKARSWLAQ